MCHISICMDGGVNNISQYPSLKLGRVCVPHDHRNSGRKRDPDAAAAAWQQAHRLTSPSVFAQLRDGSLH
ncbi:unnamed protein product [Nezara viridula]|uniref:Uncharacterized protein n=1 Tax=Nezara viridula TaxID=85310 RepID=A0A9P0MMD6_NEZVI|nr:unnamed protein product [Nezara viridula]